MSAAPPLLDVDITACYRGKPPVLDGLRLTLQPGEIAGVVGPSGCGKSTLALAVLRLLEWRGGTVRGSVVFRGRDLMTLGGRDLRRLRGREIAFVPQSPVAALNPALRMETQFREAWRAHAPDWREGRRRSSALLERMGLPDAALRSYPRQLSVGQAQRALIAMAALHRPALLVADEPTSALDPASARGILELFRGLNREYGAALLYVSHDLASVAGLCHTVAVLRGGRVAFRGPAAEALPEFEAAGVAVSS